MSVEQPRDRPGAAAAGPDDEEPTTDRPVDRFRRGAVGSVVAAGLLGLRDALEGRPEREDVVVVGEVPGSTRPPALDLHLDPDHPERSVAVVRPPASPSDPVQPDP